MKRLIMFCLLAGLLGCEYPEGDLSARAYIQPDDYEKLEEVPASKQKNETAQAFNNRKLIKTAQLQFETSDLKATSSRLRALSSQFAGFISDEKLEKKSGSDWNQIQIKVPSEYFDALIDSISGLADTFDRLEVTSQDVTEEYTDLQARIATKKKVEQRYLQLLANAKTIEEILKVEAQAAEIREEIERAEGRIRYLSTRTSMSSIHLAFYQVIPFSEPVVEQPSFNTHLVQGLENGVDILKGLLIGLANIWPLILIIGTVVFVYRKKWRKSAPAA